MLEMVEYDMLYGKRILYDGKNPYPETEMRFGVRNNSYTAQRMEDGSLVITAAENSILNEWTYVSCNGWRCEGIWDGADTITVAQKEVPPILDVVTISQIADDGTILGETTANIS